MRSKVVSWFFILMILSGLVLIFSPDSVQAAGPITIATFDETGVNSGSTSGGSIYYTYQSVAVAGSEFEISNAYKHSGSNSLKIYELSNPIGTPVGYLNLTEDYEYMSEFEFWFKFYGAPAHGYSETIEMIFYNDDDVEVFLLRFFNSFSSPNVLYRVYEEDSEDTMNLFYSVYNEQTWHHFVMQHWSDNEVNITIYNETNDAVAWLNDTCRTVEDWETFKYIKWTGVHDEQWITVYYDDFIITETIPGNTTINVYNETSPSTAIPNWNLRIYDDSSVIQYSKNTLDNPITVNHTKYGTGNMFFEISASGYYNRTYYADIKTGIHYLLNAFLLNTGNADAHVYTCIVVDDSDLDHIIYINDAEIVITRFINGSIHEISSGFTDGSGRFYVPLIAGVTYTVNITADGYDDLQDTYIPSSSVFEQTFRMASSSPTSTTYDDFWENISIDINMVSAGCMQDGNITITYLDSNSSTTNTEIRLWEIYQSNNTLLNTWVNTSNSFFNIQGSINTTRVHYMSLYFNNTAFFPVSQPMNIMIPNVDDPFCERVTPFDLDDRITKIVGPFTIDGKKVPWTVIIGSIVPIIFLVAFGPFNTGLGIICCGVSMAMMQSFLHMYVTGGFQWGIIGIGAFITILGILYVMTKGTGGDHL